MSRSKFVGLTLPVLFLLQVAAHAQSYIVAPTGTKVELAVVRPVRAESVQAGDPVYAQTIYPVAAQGEIRIPAGTYVEGKIEAVTKPTRRKAEATVRVSFRTMILADGYTVILDRGGAAPATDVTIRTSFRNDLLLDNGAQLEMTLAAALKLDATHVAKASAISVAPAPGSFRSATSCRYVAGSPGSPDTTIPGSPGTPPTVIAGGPDMPPTIIPGTPATPATVIPGAPGSAGSYCPAAPLVVSSVAIL